MTQNLFPLALTAVLLLGVAAALVVARDHGGQHYAREGCALPLPVLLRRIADEAARAPYGRHALRERVIDEDQADEDQAELHAPELIAA